MELSRGLTKVSNLTHPDLRVTKFQAGVEKSRVLYSVTEMSGNMHLGINNNDISTLSAALLERMYYCEVQGVFVPPPIVESRHFACRTFRSKLLRKIGVATPVSLDQVVEMYKGRKHTIYANARDEVAAFGYSRKDATAFSFVKAEKVPPLKAARCIQPRKARYNIVLGSYIKPIEHRLYHGIDKVFGDGPTVMKGYNVEQIARIIRGKWRSFVKPVAIGLDATKFDMHVSVAALEWEHSIYHAVYGNDPKLRELLSWQVNNVGCGYCNDGKLRYTVRGRRFSGDMNTACGNCIIMSGMVWEYAHEKAIAIKLVNNGDDCVVFMERDDEERFMSGLDAWFLRKGFRMVAEMPVYDLCKIEFCQMHPIELGAGKCIMVRNIPVVLRKDSLSTLDLSQPSTLKAWADAVGTGGLAINGGIPILQNFYRCLQRLGRGARQTKIGLQLRRNSGMYLISQGVERVFAKPTPFVRLQVFLAWGITPDEQVEMERYYDAYQFHDTVLEVDTHINYQTIFQAL